MGRVIAVANQNGGGGQKGHRGIFQENTKLTCNSLETCEEFTEDRRI